MTEPKQQPKPAAPIGFGRPGGMMGGGGVGMMPVAKAKNFKGTLAKLIQYLRPYWTLLILVIIFAIASTLFAIVSPKILGNITNQIFDDYTNIKIYDTVQSQLPPGVSISAGTTGADLLQKLPAEVTQKIPADKLEAFKKLDLSSRPVFEFDAIGRIILVLIGLYIASMVFSYIQGWIMSGISQKITFKLRKQLSEKINKLPLHYFDNTTHGDILSRITNDVDTLSQTLNQSLTQTITSVITLIGILVMMLSISWLLTLVAILIVPLSLGSVVGLLKRSQKYFKLQADKLGQLNGHIEEMYAGHTIVKVFNGEKESLQKFEGINNQLFESGWKSQFFSGLLFPILTFMGNIGYVGIAVLGGWLAINGKLNIGDIQAFIQYLQQFNQPILQTANIANVLQSTVASAERVFEFLEQNEESLDPEHAKTLTEVKGEVTFDNVVFGYNPDKVIIKGFSSKIKPGQNIAIVGPTGAGKTTMVNLLMRFYEIDKGAIRIDGVDIKDMKRSNVRKIFGMVLQDTWLFNGTIRENIVYGKPNASEDEIESATKAAHVDHFIHSLPNGYDMVLNEAADNISQGEKQLLTIARAMLANPPMLILDEATSSVDTRTEVLIQKAMDNLMKNRTSFVIAHRLSTIRGADLILVMDQGNIVEQGTHEELIKQNGFYAGLYNSQFTE